MRTNQLEFLSWIQQKVGQRVFHPEIILQISEESLCLPEFPHARTGLGFIYML